MRDWPRLIELLGSDDFGTRMEAGAALCGAGEATVQALTEGLSHARWQVRHRCVEMLGHLAEEADLELLRRALRDSAVRVRQAAIQAALSVPCQSMAAQAALTEALVECAASDPSATVRRRAINGLGLQPFHPRAAETLRAIGEKEAHPKLRHLAQWALGRQEREKTDLAGARKTQEALPTVRDILGLDPDAALPRAETLDTAQLVLLLEAAEKRPRYEAAGVLFHRGAASLAAVVAGLSHPGVLVRRACASLLDHLADDRCVMPLSEALRDPDEQVRRSALHSLTCDACKPSPLQGDLVSGLIERALHDRNIRVRRVATGVLGNYIHDAQAVTTLHTFYTQESDPVLRSRAQRALAGLAAGRGE